MTFMVELVAALYGSQEMPHWLVMSLSFQGIITSIFIHMHMYHMLMVLISHLATYIHIKGREKASGHVLYVPNSFYSGYRSEGKCLASHY